MNLANTSGTKCPKCEKSGFELVEDFPYGSAWKHMYIRCSNCKTFLQALPFSNTNVLVERLQEDIKKIKAKIGIVDFN